MRGGLSHRQREASSSPPATRPLTAEETLTHEQEHRTEHHPRTGRRHPCRPRGPRMSTHLLIAAMYLELPPSTKLTLAAIADSGDEHTLEAAPGLPKIRAWSGLSKSQALAVVAQLAIPVAEGGPGLIERVTAGRLGRRAVYRVFPNGVPAIPHPAEVAARYSTDTPVEVVDNPAKEGPAGRTLGSDEGPSRVLPTGPLHASTSVSTRAALSTGFPGARPPAGAEQPDPRTRRGHHNQPCPIHPEDTVPCRRCAHAAATSDVTKIEEAKRLARDLIRRNTTATQENQTA